MQAQTSDEQDTVPAASRDAGAAWSARREGWVRLAVVVLLALSSIAVALDLDSPLRSAATMAFLMLGPGLAVTTLLHLGDPVEQFALGVATSLAIGALVSVGLLYLGVYTYELAFAIIAAITAVALVAGVLLALRRPSLGEHPPGHAPT